jgi:hypothetical protein
VRPAPSAPGSSSAAARAVAFDWTSAFAEPARFASEGGRSMPPRRRQAGAPDIEVEVRKPTGGRGHADH